mgnify:CR=1 FL=1
MDEAMDNTQAGHQGVIDYLIASKRCEVRDLEHFLALGALVATVSDLVHKLQRERGASNLFLASHGKQFSLERQQLCCVTDTGIADFHKQLRAVEASIYHVSGGTRLFSRIASVLHMLEALPVHRAQIAACQFKVEDATRDYNQVVQALLSIVFETADAALDPILSASLVAMFNFMQGKELAGQERAAGATGFASGLLEEQQREHLHYLMDAQQRCFEVFANFADSDILAHWQQLLEQMPDDEIAQLRQLLTRRRAGEHHGIRTEPELASRWFVLMTTRIDAMKAQEEMLANHLRSLCVQRLEAAQQRLQHHESLIPMLQEKAAPPALSPVLDKTAGVNVAGQSESRPVMELLQFQAQRLQQMSEELNAARTALEERKVIERAKHLLMKHRGLSEEHAHRLLRQMAMNQSRRLIEIARSVIEMAAVWS